MRAVSRIIKGNRIEKGAKRTKDRAEEMPALGWVRDHTKDTREN